MMLSRQYRWYNHIPPLQTLHRLSFSSSKSCSKPSSTSSSTTTATYRDTLQLPRTKFPMRANGAVREAAFVNRCTTALYTWQSRARAHLPRDQTFILHDGPPFANGSLHMGHFLNKLVKDVLLRHHLLKGFRVSFIPGWDCHGLPIELKALEKARTKGNGNRMKMTQMETRRIARGLAEDTIKTHEKGFERWGVLADWESEAGTYSTMQPRYEAEQLRVFGQMVDNGLVRRSLRPVHWSPSSQTALAEAELEYRDDHVSTAAFVGFHVSGSALRGRVKEPALDQVDRVRAVVWTTTPWTLVANCAIAVHPEKMIAMVKRRGKGAEKEVLLVAEELVNDLEEKLDCSLEVIATVKGKALEGMRYKHPLEEEDGRELGAQDGEGNPPRPEMFHTFLCGKHVTADAGTGLVHTAPAHGPDDYTVWQAYGGKIESCPSPVNELGQFSRDSETLCDPIASKLLWAALDGLTVDQGSKCILERLEKQGDLLMSHEYVHRYPYDWRTKKPILVRATRQWFVQLQELKPLAAKALSKVELIPAASRGRMESMVQGRQEWCISRQRAWGVPIPALVNDETGQVVCTKDLVEQVAEKVEANGSDWWWTAGDEELKSLGWDGWKRGTDTLDVWFDSGCSWKAVLSGEKADVYMEGSDQHRGWFQSSLLTKLGYGKHDGDTDAPYAKIITHGFVLDEKNRKMSKSLGDVLEPNDFIQTMGVDVLRAWAASVDYTSDATVSRAAIDQASQALRKVRNSARFLLGNLRGFKPSEPPCLDNLSLLDRFMLQQTASFVADVRRSYDESDLRSAFSSILHFASHDVSTIYAESCKDVLYSDEEDSQRRRQCQFVLWQMLQSLTIATAPITVFLAEDIFAHAMTEIVQDPVEASVFQSNWEAPGTEWMDGFVSDRMETFLQARTHLNKLIDTLRSEELLPGRSQAELIFVNPALGQEELTTIKLLLQVADCTAVGVSEVSDDDRQWAERDILQRTAIPLGELGETTVLVVQTRKEKCERCWQYQADEANALCNRCDDVMAKQSATLR